MLTEDPSTISYPFPSLRLLQIFLKAIDSPAFLASRRIIPSELVYNLHRDWFIKTWLSQDGVSEEFKNFIKEWPHKCVIGLLWCTKNILPWVSPSHPLYGARIPFNLRNNVDISDLTICSERGREAPVIKTIISFGGDVVGLDDGLIWNNLSVQHALVSVLKIRWDGIDDESDIDKRVVYLVVMVSNEDRKMRDRINGVVFRIEGTSQDRRGRVIADSWSSFMRMELEREEGMLDQIRNYNMYEIIRIRPVRSLR
ncbi:hypothetical protein C8Q75DRAFT_807373 [Abortiporus biennis]|nr:hypothetical protein C8Q75DRAFT_807373 [Abortiporus biennis]